LGCIGVGSITTVVCCRIDNDSDLELCGGGSITIGMVLPPFGLSSQTVCHRLSNAIYCGATNTTIGNASNGLTPRELSALVVAILFNLVFAYLFEHSLIAVDVNQSLHEIWGGVFLCIHFRSGTIALVLVARIVLGRGVLRAKRQKELKSVSKPPMTRKLVEGVPLAMPLN
jgi:hypothetical protein